MPSSLHLPSYFNIWDTDSGDGYVNIDCLLPTGMMVQLCVEKDIELNRLKDMLWIEAKGCPLYSTLREKREYVFMCINQKAAREELIDEDRRLSDVRPFLPILKVIEKMGNRTEKLINSQISYLIGKGLHEFDASQSSEVKDFRRRMRDLCEKVGKQRDNKPWEERVLHLYPPDLCASPLLPFQLQCQLTNEAMRVCVRIHDAPAAFTFLISPHMKPVELVRLALTKRSNTSGQTMRNVDDYVLKLSGREEFLMTEHPLSQYQCIRKALGKGDAPNLVVIPKTVVLASDRQQMPRNLSVREPEPEPPPLPPSVPTRVGHVTWNLGDEKYRIIINSMKNVNLKDKTKVGLRIGIFHGADNMCEVCNTQTQEVMEGAFSFNQEIVFDIALPDIPRMARLCFTLFSRDPKKVKEKSVKIKQGKQEVTTMPISWVNIPVFNYKSKLHQDEQTLCMWPVIDSDIFVTEDILNPIGTVESNPDINQAPTLSVRFHNYNINGPIFYPQFEMVLAVAAENTDIKIRDGQIDPDDIDKRLGHFLSDEVKRNTSYVEKLGSMLQQTPLHELSEQEKEIIWGLRHDCQYHFPQSMPKLLNCMQWDNHNDVAQMQALLQIWPALRPSDALELLDFQYADQGVRKKAVDWLQTMSNTELQQYLLQLVQVLKYESYLDCDLVEFLLRRALLNQKIGHSLFWLLKSEMHVPSVSVRFGLILEAYLRGNAQGNYQHIKALLKQVDALTRMKSCNAVVKDDQYRDIKTPKIKDKANSEMRRVLGQTQYNDAFNGLQSPLDPALWLRQLRLDKCRFRDSKKRPLWLVWENQDPSGSEIYLMYKHGDDLKQDMLTLQIIRIMDSIWQSEGLDLRMNPYRCLATGFEEGLIEVVLDSETMANIQRQFGGAKLGAFRKESMYEWLAKNNPDPENLNKAVEEFILSCAGYCVATYVLGIGDRHNDNIMLKKNGQLFHIDFGHFLGNFKTKFGIKRERVPFVLTADFVYIMKKGSHGSDGFRRFKNHCRDAFLILRKHGNFLITLFMMMINTGIPELTCTKDVQYLAETLAMNMSEEKASEHFQQKFQEALKNSWKTSMNMFFHLLSKTNQ